MQRYSMLAKFNKEGNVNVKAIGERFANLRGNHERFGAVGDFDVILPLEAPDPAAVNKIDVAGKLAGMVDAKALPRFSMDGYRAIIEEL